MVSRGFAVKPVSFDSTSLCVGGWTPSQDYKMYKGQYISGINYELQGAVVWDCSRTYLNDKYPSSAKLDPKNLDSLILQLFKVMGLHVYFKCQGGA